MGQWQGDVHSGVCQSAGVRPSDIGLQLSLGEAPLHAGGIVREVRGATVLQWSFQAVHELSSAIPLRPGWEGVQGVSPGVEVQCSHLGLRLSRGAVQGWGAGVREV